MAIVRTAGTEILRTASFEYVAANTTAQPLIIGVQYHIYTVLSIVAYNALTTTAVNNNLTVSLLGYDALEGTTGQTMILFKTGTTNGQQTYVWNDKFSFNGAEPTNFTGPMNDATKQNAVADQAQNTAQKLQMQKGANGDDWHVHITYIDQNNA